MYEMLREYTRLALSLFYRRIILEGLENIPTDGSTLIVANHQNALMDALLPVCHWPQPIYFLARSDIFRNPHIARILYWLKIIPVYRKRDGLKEPLKNAESFDQCYQWLAEGKPVLIFPEANQVMQRSVRKLSKGFSRIAFGALEARPDLKLYVLPLGINYEHYSNFNTVLRLRVGKPLEVWKYVNGESVAKGAARLTADVEEALKKLCVHIDAQTEAAFFESPEPSGEQLSSPKYFRASPPTPAKNGGRVFVGQLSRWFFYPPRALNRYIVEKLVKDPHFQPSLKFGLHLIFIPAYLALLIGLGLAFSLDAWAWLIWLAAIGLLLRPF
jgi:1-acyl-sn-glycerol-3-phosphate acyltransferase